MYTKFFAAAFRDSKLPMYADHFAVTINVLFVNKTSFLGSGALLLAL
jgi:hypothetical protein